MCFLYVLFMFVNIMRDSKYVYVFSYGLNIFRKFDIRIYKEIVFVEVGLNLFVFFESGVEGYVVSYDSDEVCVIDMKNLKIK